MATPRSGRVLAKPPEKGVFPLDHFGECKKVADDYQECLKRSDGQAAACAELAAKYLQCRMARNLMVEQLQDLSELGLGPEDLRKRKETNQHHGGRAQDRSSSPSSNRARSEKGFVSGTRTD